MIAPLMHDGLTLQLIDNVVSVPYINMTLSLMHYFGIESTFDGTVVQVAPQAYQARPFVVENDWSAASYWYAVVALHGNASITLPHLYANSWQGDSELVRLFEPLGVVTTFTAQGVVISSKEVQLPLCYACNLGAQPDLAQPLVVACLMLGVSFRFSGLGNLKIKETDRIAALIAECRKMGFVLKEVADGVLAWGGEKTSPMTPLVIDTYEDHRMAMAFAPAVLKLGEIKINNPQVVTKSYPKYWKEFEKLLQINALGL